MALQAVTLQFTRYSSGISTPSKARGILSINPVDIFKRQLKNQIFRYPNPFIFNYDIRGQFARSVMGLCKLPTLIVS